MTGRSKPKKESSRKKFLGKKIHFPRIEEEILSTTDAGAATPNQDDLVSRPGRMGPPTSMKAPQQQTIDRSYNFGFENEVGDDTLTSLFDENYDRFGVEVVKSTNFKQFFAFESIKRPKTLLELHNI